MLDIFRPAVAEWFASSFPEPTRPQALGWPRIAAGEHTLICAPTGSGKTLTAFLWSINRLTADAPPAGTATRVIYVSPLRALAFDVEKNLRAPLAGIALAAERRGESFHDVTVGLRTGDTPARDRQAMLRRPPDLLITTPESLYLMLTSQARRTLADVDTVIIDEIHALAGTKRGAHLMMSLERLARVTKVQPQRIGLSATQRPLEETARFLGGYSEGRPRDVAIVDAGVRKPLELEVVVPVEDMGEIGQPVVELTSGPATAALTPRRTSIWPSLYPQILEQVLAHRSTIIFCNARRQAERLAANLNELAVESGMADDLVKAHHGSLAREQRIVIEDQLKKGTLRGLVATSSLELGIDMGAVDLVIQVESPGAVSRGLQRIGRAGHGVGEASRGRLFPKHRGDLVETAVVARRMVDGLIESTRYLRNPLDVLAQQIVAEVAIAGETTVADLAVMVRRCANFAEISDEVLHNVLDLLAGRYPSDEFNELRPRLVWDRVADRVRARDGAQRLAVTNGGTIPDRGLYGVFLPDGTRVGELDEEMVYESRPGETFLLGASTWRIEDITHQKVIVSPAPGEPAKMPFWHGDQLGRPAELGRAVGEFQRRVRELRVDEALDELTTRHFLDAFAANNVVNYLAEQAEATGVVPDDRTIVVERFRDELGDWRMCIHSPYGVPVHAPWAMAIEHHLRERLDMPVDMMYADDGIVLRLPEALENLPLEDLLPDPETVDETLVGVVPGTALFAARFRECAGRALLLPRRRPDQRTPLWQQRQRAADLLAVASKFPAFPMLLETSRECLQDVFDLPALREVLADVRSRRIKVVAVDTPRPSPFAQSLLFNWIAMYMYGGDAPLAERRAAALSLDRELLNELLGAEELRELLDVDAITEVELAAQCIADGRRARSIDELHDVLRKVGDLSRAEIDVRCEVGVAGLIDELVDQRRAISVAVAGEQRFAAAEDAALYRDALGCSLPLGLPRDFTEPVARPLEALVARFARTHAPFTTAVVASRFAVTIERVLGALRALEADGRVVLGEFQPRGVEREWCDTEVLRQIRRRSLAALRREIEPVEHETFARFLPAWHGIATAADERTASGRVTGRQGGPDALVDVIQMLQGVAIVASTLENDVLPQRVRGYRPTDLDALFASGEVVWVGAGAIGSNDGRIRLFFADQIDELLPAYDIPEAPSGQLHEAIRLALRQRGASFWNGIVAATPQSTDGERLAALWDLVWAGEVTNDTLTPLRSLVGGARSGSGRRSQRPTNRPRSMRLTRVGPPAGSGRWSFVGDVSEGPADDTAATVNLHAIAMQMLQRHGVVTREAVLAEGVKGGFAGVYGVLKVLEERGSVRRGYFVDGLGAAQFALPGAVDRLRGMRDTSFGESDADANDALVIAATDPAQPYGSVLGWPTSAGRPARTASALVILRAGRPLAWYDTRSGNLVVLGDFDAVDARTVASSLARTGKDGRVRSVTVRKIDGSEPTASPHAELLIDELRAAGFVEGYRGYTLR